LLVLMAVAKKSGEKPPTLWWIPSYKLA